jgi:hypothetical protein
MGMIIFGTIAIVGLAILFGFVLMWLWNWLMPDIFGLTTITYWQAVGLFILLKILLGGCGGSGSSKKKSPKHSKRTCENKSGTDFSKWKHYNKFWREEGDQHFQDYLKRQSNPREVIDPKSKQE